MVLTTRVFIAKAGTKSIKSTIPEGIVEYLQLSDKDEIEWNMDMQNNERIAIVSKKRNLDERTRKLVKGYVNLDKVKKNG
jgi:antitoxin component of MazEF toxin-antitoxin module